MPTYVMLPPNLCSEKKHVGKSVYYRDYCSRIKNKKTRSLPNTYLGNANISLPLGSQYFALTAGYGQKDLNNTIDSINQKMKNTTINYEDADISSDQFIEKAPDTMRKIENAWVKEVDTNKRERGLIYGVAGKKMNMNHKKSKSENDRSIAGLDDWLRTANEYEKEVVHKFVATVTDSMRKPRPEYNDSPDVIHRPRSTSSILPNNTTTLKKTVRIKSAPLTPGSFKCNSSRINVRKSTPVRSYSAKITSGVENGGETQLHSSRPDSSSSQLFVATRKSSPDDKYIVDPRIPSPSSSRASSRRSVKANEASTQIPYQYGSKLSSPFYDKIKSKSTPNLHHTCKNCKACLDKEVKKMLKNTSNDGFQIEEPQQFTAFDPEEDYMHNGTSFQLVNRFKKPYYIIHPDFVSENGGNLAAKRKLDKRYFGE